MDEDKSRDDRRVTSDEQHWTCHLRLQAQVKYADHMSFIGYWVIVYGLTSLKSRGR